VDGRGQRAVARPDILDPFLAEDHLPDQTHQSNLSLKDSLG
jgi:hypothetical protein